MKRICSGIAMIVLFVAGISGSANAGPSVNGKWKVIDRGVDGSQKPCPFVPDWIEFFADGTVAMANLPQGMRMLYRTAVSDSEAKTLLVKFPYVKDKDHMLLMKPSREADWLNNAMAYRYTVKAGELYLEIAGWTASRYARSKK